jgi:hypothetical protein
MHLFSFCIRVKKPDLLSGFSFCSDGSLTPCFSGVTASLPAPNRFQRFTQTRTERRLGAQAPTSQNPNGVSPQSPGLHDLPPGNDSEPSQLQRSCGLPTAPKHPQPDNLKNRSTTSTESFHGARISFWTTSSADLIDPSFQRGDRRAPVLPPQPFLTVCLPVGGAEPWVMGREPAARMGRQPGLITQKKPLKRLGDLIPVSPPSLRGQ